MGFLKKAFKKVKSYASGLLKPIDDYLGTDFAHVDDRNAQINENNSARAFEAQQKQLDRNFNAQEAEKARTFNAQQAELERQWQTEMSNTARQRAAADYAAAGINPVLAAGAEASSGASAAATGPSAISSGGSTPSNSLPPSTARKMHALEMKMAREEIEKVKAEKDNTKSKTKNEKDITKATVKNLNANTTKTDKETPYGGKSIGTISKGANSARDVLKLLPFGKFLW